MIVPRNGYVNRLQAIVSAQALAQSLGATLGIGWERQPAAPVDIDAVLDPRAVPAEYVDVATSLTGAMKASQVPVGITRGVDGVVFLAGGMAGEQVLMPALRRQLEEGINELVIVAGGKFWLPGDQHLTTQQADQFRSVRRELYANLKLNAGIEEQAREVVAGLPDRFLGLHLRYSDRNQQAPSKRSIREALSVVRDDVEGNVYIAGDDLSKVAEWRKWLDQHGWNTWVNETSQAADVESRKADALVDWRILGAAHRLLYFAESSFGEEAAVASGCFDESRGLECNRVRSIAVTTAGHLRNLVTYPSRHWT